MAFFSTVITNGMQQANNGSVYLQLVVCLHVVERVYQHEPGMGAFTHK